MRVKRILYWVTIGILIAVIVACVGMIAYKFITDAKEQAIYDELLESMPDRDPSQTLPPKETDPHGNPIIPTDPDPIAPSDPGPSRPRPVFEESEVLFRYRSLYSINSDMVGFIEIPGTAIKYPVVQSLSQANYYLRRNFYKQSATCGSIYVREACDVFKPSDNITIYGHKMTNGTMFADLHKYKKQSFWEDNSQIYFDTLTEYHTYEIFAVFQTEANQGNSFNYHLFDDASTEAEFDQFVKSCKALSFYDTGITPTYGDKLITLSTCDKSLEDGRFVVVARRID
jgi:sortase B